MATATESPASWSFLMSMASWMTISSLATMVPESDATVPGNAEAAPDATAAKTGS